MFGRKKMYKQGLAHAMQAYEGFAEKQKAALDVLRQEVRAGNVRLEEALSGLGEDINGVYDYLTSKEKAALYQLSTPLDLKELEDEERRLLLAVLYQLADDEGSSVTDAQRAYIRSVQKYLEITNPQINTDLSIVGDIDSLEIQKAFLQTVLEFFYLQNQDELTDGQEDFLGNFSVNRKQAELIENQVGRLYNAVGAQGIVEKYGYVPQEEKEQLAADAGALSENIDDDWVEVQDGAIHALFEGMPTSELTPLIETEKYLFTYRTIRGMTHITYVCKRDNQVSTASLSMEYPENVIKYTGSPDTILLRYYDSQYGKLGLLSLPDEKFETLSLNLGPHSYFLCCNSHYIVGAEEHQAGCEIWIYNVKTCQVNKVPVPFGVTAFHKIAAISDEKLYLWAGSPHYSADTKDNILDVIDYKNSGACVAQMKFKPMDLECLFDPQKWYFMGHDPNQILVYKNYVLVPMYRQINRSAANSTRAIVFCLIDPHEREIVKTIDPSPSFPFGLMGGQEQELILYKEKLIVVDPFVGICTVDLETAETSIMVEQRTFFSGIIGPYLYFSDNNYRSSKFRINIDNPSMVENIP